MPLKKYQNPKGGLNEAGRKHFESKEGGNLQAQKEGLEADYITKLGGFRTAELKLQKETNDAKAEKEKETNEKIAADREEFVKRQGESAEKEKKYFKDLHLMKM